MQQQPSSAWCCTASLDPLTKKPVISSVADGFDHDHDPNRKTSPYLQILRETSFDITASPDWMEWIELVENREMDEGGAGAYDTMRCDVIVKAPVITNADKQTSMIIWGEDYHLKRLQNSFLSLLSASTVPTLPTNEIEKATQDSHLLLKALVEEATSSQFLRDNSMVAPGEKEDDDHTWIQLLKLTLLWSLPKENQHTNNFQQRRQQQQQQQQPDKESSKSSSLSSSSLSSSIVVRGHACSTGKPLPVFRSVQPITVTVAALGHKHDGHHTTTNTGEKEDAIIDSSLPTRFQNPQSKVASWCKQRKKIDNPETYKPRGVSEVLMVRPINGPKTKTNKNEHNGTPLSSLELLEGLSSNVFVIYKDGTLRTAQEGVLNGYVRHLVLEAAPNCGLRVDTTKPITLQDAVDGKWSEAFITSSSRLIWPISRILLPASEDESCDNSDHIDNECEIAGFKEFWCDPAFTKPGISVATPQWQDLLDTILHSEGYKR